jgi:CRP-like cAMP-binding protein
LEAIATTTRYHCGQAIFSQTGQVEYWYRVLSGAAKVAVIQFNGKRQIIDLLLPGDFLAVLTTEEHEFALEAITEGTVIACYPRQQIEELADSDPRIAREVRILAFETVSRLQEQLLILGRTTSTEKVGCFLLKMSERLGHRSDKVVLPMSRYDIADYLAISVETVCRAMTTLSDRGVIALSGKRRSIRIVDRGALEEDHDSEFGDRNGQVPKIISRS